MPSYNQLIRNLRTSGSEKIAAAASRWTKASTLFRKAFATIAPLQNTSAQERQSLTTLRTQLALIEIDLRHAAGAVLHADCRRAIQLVDAAKSSFLGSPGDWGYGGRGEALLDLYDATDNLEEAVRELQEEEHLGSHLADQDAPSQHGSEGNAP